MGFLHQILQFQNVFPGFLLIGGQMHIQVTGYRFDRTEWLAKIMNQIDYCFGICEVRAGLSGGGQLRCDHNFSLVYFFEPRCFRLLLGDTSLYL